VDDYRSHGVEALFRYSFHPCNNCCQGGPSLSFRTIRLPSRTKDLFSCVCDGRGLSQPRNNRRYQVRPSPVTKLIPCEHSAHSLRLLPRSRGSRIKESGLLLNATRALSFSRSHYTNQSSNRPWTGAARDERPTRNAAISNLLPPQLHAQTLSDKSHKAGLKIDVLQDSGSKADLVAEARKSVTRAEADFLR
jgi:hypothetical protein